MWNQILSEAWSGRNPSIKHLRVFDCVFYAQLPKEKRYKLDEASEKCIFVRYSTMSKGYKLCGVKTNKIVISGDVIFEEKAKQNWEQRKEDKQFVPITISQQNIAQ